MSRYNNEVWYLDHRNLHQLCEWLADHCGFTESQDVIQVVEKPYNWSREWELCELYFKHINSSDAKSRGICERCIEACEETDADAATVALEFEVLL